MNDYIFRAGDSLEGFANQVRARLHQNLNGHVVGNQVAVNQCAQCFVFGIGSRGEPDLNLFKSNVYQCFEKQKLFLQVHGSYQSLISVAQVYAAPYGGLFDCSVGPLTVL